MPKTVIAVITYMCPNGIGKHDPILGVPDGTCRAQGPKGSTCARCRLPLVRATLPGDLGTITVMGEEDIEQEFPQLDAERIRKKLSVYTDVEKEVHRVARRNDIARAIVKARERKHKP